ncbi:MAG: lysophospholipase [Oscillospiraceae bacterium]|nr:lysophospholipase [Oscillospiraceae bacterium]
MKKLFCLFLSILFIAAACAPQVQEPDAESGATPEVAEELNADEAADFISEQITLGAGTEWAVDGMLTLPADGEKFPAVVLVHGSGAHDMDETIFENKPFRDIAEYLSSNGIAVLRYDMRTFTHGERIVTELGGSLTVWEEKVEDAIFAAELLRADARIDSDRIFMLGHSMGGMLAPQIHAEGGDFAGLILFAGSPRFLLDISKDQNIDYIEEMFEGAEKAVMLAQMQTWDDQIAALMELSDEEARETVFDPNAGLYVYYLKDMYFKPAADFIADTSIPFLVMHAENDVQVSLEKDFELYKELLAGRDNVTFKLYEGLNHLFMTGEKAGIMELLEQYAIPGKVDSQVLADIAEWIHAN